MKRIFALGVFGLLLFLPQEGKAASVGTAAWYSELDPGINLTTANGEIFDDSKRTCASWHHPFGTYLRVTRLDNGKSILCRVNDRGPAKRLGRLIDLTKAAFQEIAPLRVGLIRVKVEMVREAVSEPTSKGRSLRA